MIWDAKTRDARRASRVFVWSLVRRADVGIGPNGQVWAPYGCLSIFIRRGGPVWPPAGAQIRHIVLRI